MDTENNTKVTKVWEEPDKPKPVRHSTLWHDTWPLLLIMAILLAFSGTVIFAERTRHSATPDHSYTQGYIQGFTDSCDNTTSYVPVTITAYFPMTIIGIESPTGCTLWSQTAKGKLIWLIDSTQLESQSLIITLRNDASISVKPDVTDLQLPDNTGQVKCTLEYYPVQPSHTVKMTYTFYPPITEPNRFGGSGWYNQ